MNDKTVAAYAATLLRVSMGVMLLAHGFLLKFLEYGVAGTVGHFVSTTYPVARDLLGEGELALGPSAGRATATSFKPRIAR